MVGIIGTTSPLPPISLLVLVLLLLLLHSTCESFQFRWDGISRLGGWPTAKITKSTTTTTSTSVVVIDRGNPRHAVIGHRDDEDDRSSWRLHAAVRPDEVEIGDDDDDDYDDETEMEEDTVEKKTVRPPPSRTPRNIGSAGGTRTPAAADFASVGDFDARLDVEIRGALRRAEIDLARMTMVGGGDDGGGGGDGGGEVITFAAETPGERLMREYESIDVTATSSSSPSPVSSIDEDADNDGATLLMEARREADEAESMLRLAEEEAARWERELAYLEREAEIADIVSSASAERVSLSSMADAYRVALDAANDNVEVLMAQVAGLESELIDVKSRMERSVEERERIGAEYAFLAKNYGDLKRRSEEGSSSSGSADGASTRLSIDLLNGEIEAYKSRIADAETRLDIMELSLAEAKDEAEKWRNMHDEVMSRMETAAKAREAEHAEEMRVERESYELRALEANANLEEEKLRLRLEADGIIDAMRAEFDRSIEDNTKMISALREALRKTRREGKKAIEESSSTSAAEVDNIRTRMNEEVANLKSVLKSVQGEMDEKEREVQRAMEGREETEKLMEEIRVLRLSFENERMKSAQDSAEYEERLSSFVDTENAFKRQLEEKEGLISSLTREMDASTKQVEALKLELKILEGKVQDAQSSEASNAALMREFADERCGMEIRVAETEEKIAFLEEELKTKRDAVSSAEMALDESRKALDAVRTQYVEKTESAKKLEEELRITVAKLADAEASRLQSESQGKEASTKMIQSLQSQTSDLAVQLKAANDDANESKQKLKDYEAKIVSMQENLTKLSSDLKLQLKEKEGTIIRLMQEKDASVKQVEAMKLEMEALESMANDARSLEALNASLMKELSDERSAMESLLARTEQKTASLEKELKAQRDALTSTEKALDEAQTALDSVRTQYAGEEASVKKLEAELETMKAKLADAEASQQKSASQERDASAKQIRLLQTQA
ncbi:hypothetical protein ACHAXA_002184 [Cyclostephanos tholiformis]|uniref:Uncharacterized protein n=1 Tax=Cyclostephanos tholiformis TaxID=382380 RepID=A0ABD3RVK8_9STRA